MGKYDKLLSKGYIWRMDILIFVTLGTQDKPFYRLLKTIDDAITNGIINDRVIVQSGYTKYESNKMEIFPLIDRKEFEKIIQEADLLITHGGVGSIITGLNYNKKVIATPRLSIFKEHVNDHQMQIIKCFEKEQYIIPLYDLEKLEEALVKSKSFTPKKYTSNNQNFISILQNLIEN